MSDSLSIHRVVSVKALVTEPLVDVLDRTYCNLKLTIEKEDGTKFELTVFGRGIREGDDTDPQTMIYPFVEIERPKVESEE